MISWNAVCQIADLEGLTVCIFKGVYRNLKFETC
jgi:hypothetical protein